MRTGNGKRQRTFKKTISLISAFTLTLGTFSTLAPLVSAEVNGDATPGIVNEAYYNGESLQPLAGGYSVDTLLKWTPQSDPDARYNRASIPLPKDAVDGKLKRFAGPQVNDYATPDARLMACTLSNANHDSTPAQGSETFDSYAFTYWQYVDSMVYWAGSDEGIFVTPTPDMIDSAHKNGVPITATLGFPWGQDTTEGKIRIQEVAKFVQKAADGTFPVADKMVEMAEFYGFDGYFFNQETYGCSADMAADMAEMMKYVHEKYPDIIFNWYDSMTIAGNVSYVDGVNDSNKMWIEVDPELQAKGVERPWAADEFFMNYNWAGNHENPSYTPPYNKIETTIDTMIASGRTPYDAYAGWELQANSYNKAVADHALVDENGKLRLSVALYCPNSTMGFSKDPENFHQVEKRFWVSSTGDPTNEPIDPTDTSNRGGDDGWVGLARFFTDKSVITEAPFVTNFNTGHGKQWFIDGEVSRTSEWNNRSVQDILPTWTWIVRSKNENGSTLSGDYDFNTAVNGPNSVKFAGKLDENNENEVRLYSTRIETGAATTPGSVEISLEPKATTAVSISLTYKENKASEKVQLAVCFGNGDENDTYDAKNWKYFDLTPGAEKNGWKTGTVGIPANSGTITALGINVVSKNAVEGYQLNLGQIAVTDSAPTTLPAPASVTLDEIMYDTANTAQVRMYWEPVANAAYYEIYRVSPTDGDVIINATPNSAYYIRSLLREGTDSQVTVRVVPVAADGTRGTGEILEIDWGMDPGSTEEPVYEDWGMDPARNLCLNEVNAEVTDYSGQGDAEPAWKAIDGTSLNGSKWCATNDSDRGWMTIKLKQEATVKRIRLEHAEAGGEGHINNTIAYTVQYRDAEGNWKVIPEMNFTDNEAAVNDVVLKTPVTAQEFKLDITRGDGGQWKAVRIYEWQMFASDELPQTEFIPMVYASAVNNEGALDTFTLTHVPAGHTVKVFLKQADGSYKQIASDKANATGIVSFDGLDFGSAAGRVYYATNDGVAGDSAMMSTPFTAENAAVAAKAKNVVFAFEANAVDPAHVYANITVKDLAAGDVIKIYDSTSATAECLKRSLPVADGSTEIKITNVELIRSGGAITLEVESPGKKPSGKYMVAYDAFPEAKGTLSFTLKDIDGTDLTGAYALYKENGTTKVADISFTGTSAPVKVGNLAMGTYILRVVTAPAGYPADKDRNIIVSTPDDITVPITLSKEFTITITQPENGTLAVASKTAAAKSVVAVSATPDDGYRLKAGSIKATGTTDVEVTELNRFVMPAENVTITGEFEAIPSYQITVDQDALAAIGSITVDKETAKPGETVTITPEVLDAAYAYTGVKVNGRVYYSTTITMPDEAVTLIPVFEAKTTYETWNYDTDQPANGTLSVSPNRAYEGQTVTVTAAPDDGYRLAEGSLKVQKYSNRRWVDLTVTPVEGNPNEFTYQMEATSYMRIEGEFEETDYAITVEETVNGKVIPSVYYAVPGTEVTLDVKPDAGYIVSSLTANDGAIAITENKFTMPEGDVVIKAVFVKDPTLYQISSDIVNGGSIKTDTPNSLAGDQVQVTLQPNEGYRYVAGSLKATPEVSFKAVEGSANTFTFTMPNENVNLTASFEKIPDISEVVDAIDNLPVPGADLTQDQKDTIEAVVNNVWTMTDSEKKALPAESIEKLDQLYVQVYGVHVEIDQKKTEVTENKLPDNAVSTRGEALAAGSNASLIVKQEKPTVENALLQLDIKLLTATGTIQPFTPIYFEIRLPEALKEQAISYLLHYSDAGAFLGNVPATNENGVLRFAASSFSKYIIPGEGSVDPTPPDPPTPPTPNRPTYSNSASFSEYSITATAGEGGSITPAGETKVKAGATQVYTVKANDGYRVDKVMVDGNKEVTLTNGTYTFENVAEPYTIHATFVKSSGTETSNTPDTSTPSTPSTPSGNINTTPNAQTSDATNPAIIFVLLGAAAVAVILKRKGFTK